MRPHSPHRSSTPHRVALGVLLLAAGLAATSSLWARKIPDGLAPKFRVWLEEVDLLLSKKEWKAFLALEEDYQRDGFIARFWDARDPDPATDENEFKEEWYSRLDYGRETFGSLADDRTRMLLLNGTPEEVKEEHICPHIFLPHHLWFYYDSERTTTPTGLVFYQTYSGRPYALWYPTDGIHALLAETVSGFWEWCPETRDRYLSSPRNGGIIGAPIEEQMRCLNEQMFRRCRDAAELQLLLAFATRGKGMDYLVDMGRLESRVPERSSEWLESFHIQSTELAEGTPTFPAQVEWLYPGRQGQRTVVQGVLTVDRGDAATGRPIHPGGGGINACAAGFLVSPPR